MSQGANFRRWSAIPLTAVIPSKISTVQTLNALAYRFDEPNVMNSIDKINNGVNFFILILTKTISKTSFLIHGGGYLLGLGITISEFLLLVLNKTMASGSYGLVMQEQDEAISEIRRAIDRRQSFNIKSYFGLPYLESIFS